MYVMGDSSYRLNFDQEENIDLWSSQILYTGCIKKTEQIWNCSQFRKTAISIQFFIYMASLGTYNVE
jgi:hypothetical protein